MLNRPHSITATVEIPDSGAEGVLLCQGTAAGGYSLFVQDGRLHYVHNYVGRSLHKVPHRNRYRRAHTSSGSSSSRPARRTWRVGVAPRDVWQLYVDEQLVAEEQAAVTTPFVFNPGALTCGANPGSPVTPDYRSPFRFTGTLHSAVVDVSGDLITDTESEMRVAMARQ